MFWENFVDLCNKNGISPTALCEALGYSNATATKWRKGAMPRPATVQKISDHFNVSVDYLLGTEKEKPSLAPDLTDEEKALLELFRAIPAEKKSLVLDLLKSL